MKKISLFLVSVFCVLLFAGCGEKNPPLPVKEMGECPVAMQTVTIPDPYRKIMSYKVSLPEGWYCGTPTSHQIVAGFADIANNPDYLSDIPAYLRIQNYLDGHSGSKQAHQQLFAGKTAEFQEWLNSTSLMASAPFNYKRSYSEVQLTDVYEGTHGRIYVFEYLNTYEDSSGLSTYKIRNYCREDISYSVMVTLNSSRAKISEEERPFQSDDVALWVIDSLEVEVE